MRTGVSKVVEDPAYTPMVGTLRGGRHDHRLGRGRERAALLRHLRRRPEGQARHRSGWGNVASARAITWPVGARTSWASSTGRVACRPGGLSADAVKSSS